MGVYYFFYNKSNNNEQNKHVLSGRLCDFVTKFDQYFYKDQIEIFKKCIELNEWKTDDIIIAVPDYYDHDVLVYDNGDIYIDNTDKDQFFKKNDEESDSNSEIE